MSSDAQQLDSESPRNRRHIVLALAIGVALFGFAISRLDPQSLTASASRLTAVAPWLLLASGCWHLLRTLAWSYCFAPAARPRFLRLARVRLAAEAFSYLSIWGVGEPLKVVMLDETPASASTAALVLERVVFVVVTTAIVAVSAIATVLALDLERGWKLAFGGMPAVLVAAFLLAWLVAAVRRRRLGPRAATATPAAGVRQRLAMFLLEVRRDLALLLRSDRRRLALVATLLAGCHLTMVAEVWLVLRGAGIPVTIGEANAIETFTRVVSFLSAFIPANLGALEASNIAAATAVGAGSAGGALAIVRRLRGLFWAGVGLAVYPRRRARAVRASDDGDALVYIAEKTRGGVSPFERVVSLPIAERVLRAASAAGYRVIWVYATEEPQRTEALARRLHLDADVTVVAAAASWRRLIAEQRDRAVTVVGPGIIPSTSLLRTASRLAPDARPRDVPAGVDYPTTGVVRARTRDVADIAPLLKLVEGLTDRTMKVPSVDEVTHARADLVIHVETPGDVPLADAFLEKATYKATDPYLAEFNRRISIPVSRLLLPTAVTANQVSIAIAGVGFYAAWLFSRGTYASMVAGAVLSLAASIADGCDGEIARLKYQESSFGCWLETVGDYSYYVAIFTGMTIGAVRYTGWPYFYHIGMAAVAAMLLTFAILIVLRRRITGGRPERLQLATKAHFYASGSRWASLAATLSFCGTRSSMPYGILAFALAGLLPGILVLAAIGANIFWIALALRFRALTTA